MTSPFKNLSEAEVSKIRQLGQSAVFTPDEPIFHEGDKADSLYLIESGGVSLYIEKFSSRSEIQRGVPGDWFGEVAVFDRGYRTASAQAVGETRLLKVSAEDFHALLAREPDVARVISDVVVRRNRKLVLQEKMVDSGGYSGYDMHIGIKGDPSLRESAMERARYESVVDKHLSELAACFEDLLVNRTAHRIMIGFNNGEIRISTLLDPFSEEFHPALRLLDASYVERHFPRIDYERKAQTIRAMYKSIGEMAYFGELPSHLQQGFTDYFRNWQPLPVAEIPKVIAQLPQLRTISNFYARSTTINIAKDAIQMQFNCDGSHIVSMRGFERFVEENL